MPGPGPAMTERSVFTQLGRDHPRASRGARGSVAQLRVVEAGIPPRVQRRAEGGGKVAFLGLAEGRGDLLLRAASGEQERRDPSGTVLQPDGEPGSGQAAFLAPAA